MAEGADVERVVNLPEDFKSFHVGTFERYKQIYEESVKDPRSFWDKMAKENLHWFQPYSDVLQGSFKDNDVRWFLDGQLNVSYNCVDRHVKTQGDQIAIIHEGNEVGETTTITYKQLLHKVCKLANVLKRTGVRKGDTVCIYLPNIPEAAFAMLACTRIGAIHSVVFAGFSEDALAERINDAKCSVVITADASKRGPKVIPLKSTVDRAILRCPSVKHILVHFHLSPKLPSNWDPNRDVSLNEAMEMERPFCPCERMDSEDPLFLLYTSGSTGKPKGVCHTTAGYLLYTMLTHKYVFDYNPGEIFACVADVGWITGHSYILYGPLANGATTVMFESTPLHPDASRYWDLVERLKINLFYTAPTAIRALMRYGDEKVTKHNLSSLRVLGTVGEPINPSAWDWYFNVVGQKRCAIVDTYWQTETGGHLLTPIPGAIPMKPGSATLPFFGIVPVVLDEQTGIEKTGNDVSGVLCIAHPWPSITRTVWGCHARYINGYFAPYPGYYFTGDGCHRDKDGYYWITGRVDDVLNVSGHRLGTAEIESALVQHESAAEAAVVGVPHDIKGQSIFAFVTLKEGYEASEQLRDELKFQVRKIIGPFAQPDTVEIVPGLPKTRSGKIMRRLLRKIATREISELGDISTLADPSIVETIIAQLTEKH